MVEEDAVGREFLDVAAEPLGFACTDEVEDGGVDHGGFGEEAGGGGVFGWGEVREVAVEEETEEVLRDEGEGGFGAEDVEGEEDVDEEVARDDPFF